MYQPIIILKNKMSLQLQGQHIDIVKGLREVSTIKHSLHTARESIDIYTTMVDSRQQLL